jgi:MFS family permease
MNSQLKVNFLAHFTDGLMFSVFGPIIPFFSEMTGLIESEFNYIFALRGVAYVIAGILQKSLLSEIKLAVRMQACMFIAGVCFLLFANSYNNSFYLSIFSFILNMAIGSISVLVNVCLMDSVKEDAKYYVSLSYGVYGVGGMIGPILISFFGVNGLNVIGVWAIVLGFIYFKVKAEPKAESSVKLI